MLKNQRRELFSQEIAKGLSYTDAYRCAYPNSLTWKDATVWRKSSLMAAIPEVKDRITELREAAQDDTIMKVVELKQILTRNLRRVDEGGDVDGVVRLSKIVAEVIGAFAPQQIVTQTRCIPDSVAAMSDEELEDSL